MPRLKKVASKIISSPLGHWVARPWLDKCVLYFLKNWYFPLSRLWAAARAAEGDVDRFIKQVPLHEPSRRQRLKIALLLHNFEVARLKAHSMEQLWRHYFFGSETVAAERLPIAEEMRLDFRSAFNLYRKKFWPLRRLVKTSVAMAPPTPQEVEQRFGEMGELVKDLFLPPETFPEVEVSKSIPTSYGKDYWLRFKSPHAQMNDEVYARVYEPTGIENPPTLIFGHGICVEFDQYHQLLSEVDQLTKFGIRVIKPEAPWHGRRVLPGHYGGEQFLSKIPISMFDFIGAQHKEWATLINWCRENSSGPLGVGGSSLGAQTAKTIAMNASDWPQHLKPDALFAITHSQNISEAATKGALSDIWNLGESMRAAGWHSETEVEWLKRLDPPKSPCMEGAQIVSVYGRKDSVTPVKSAIEQMNSWNVPAQNRFLYNRGHFSTPLGLLFDNEPIERFAEILLATRKHE